MKRLNQTLTMRHVLLGLLALMVTVAFTVYSYVVFGNGSAYPGGDPYLVWSMVLIIGMFVLIWIYTLVLMGRDLPLERLYLIFGLFFGVVFLFFIPPYGTPDETAHIKAAYHVSNLMLGTGCPEEGTGLLLGATTGTGVNMRLCDQTTGFVTDFDRGVYNYMFENLFARTGDTTLTVVPGAANTPGLLYLVSGAGIAVARLLHMNSVGLLLFGSAVNMVLFVACAWYSIRRAPFAKLAFFAVALMPMTLQQTSSYSYDNLILSAALMVTSQALAFAYDRASLRRRDYVLFSVAAFVLTIAKSGAYVLLVFLPVLMGLKRKWFTRKRALLLALFCGLAVLLVLRDGIFQLLLPSGTEAPVTGVEGQGAYIDWAADYAYRPIDYLRSPMLLVNVVYNTVVGLTSSLVEGMVAGGLGWMSLGVPSLPIYGFLAVALLGVFPAGEETYTIPRRHKLLMLAAALISIGLCAMAMLLYFTPKDFGYIVGLQGRYFLPVLLPAILTLRSGLIRIDRRLNRWLILLLLLLEFGTLYYVAYGLRFMN